MNPSKSSRDEASTVAQEPPTPTNPVLSSSRPIAAPRSSPVLQTLLIVGILLAGLVAGVFILRSEKKAPAGEAPEEKTAAGHGHDEKGEHGAKGRVELTPEKLENANLGLETVGPTTIYINLSVFGKIVPNEEKLAHVSPRFAGIVRKVNKRLGESVNAGEVLATVESNESLQSYDIKAPLAGTIIERSVSVGEFVGTDKSLFTVVDLSTVWVDFQIYQQDFPKLSVGQAVQITTNNRVAPPTASGTPPPLAQTRPNTGIENSEKPAGDGDDTLGRVSSTIAYLSPFGSENTQTMLARASVSNEGGRLRPGLFVTGLVAVDELKAPLAVREAAVQSLEGKEVVFVQEGDAFEARPVEIGRRDHEWAEILAGLKAGDRYVSVNSFILKAEIGKEGAEHED